MTAIDFLSFRPICQRLTAIGRGSIWYRRSLLVFAAVMLYLVRSLFSQRVTSAPLWV